MCVRSIEIFSRLRMIFLFDFGTVLTVWHFFVFHLISCHYSVKQMYIINFMSVVYVLLGMSYILQ